MFESIFDSAGTITVELGFKSVGITLAAAFLLGLYISFIYMKTVRDNNFTQGFILTLVMLPAIISIIILLIGSNVARAFSLAGAFSIIRFRSSMGNPKDIAYVFFDMAIGLALGVDFVGYAVIFAVVLGIFMIILSFVGYGADSSHCKIMKILVPEDLNFEDAFTDVMNKYTDFSKLMKIRTSDLGSIYQLEYKVNVKNGASEKEFIDELRCRNGNLNISLSLPSLEEG